MQPTNIFTHEEQTKSESDGELKHSVFVWTADIKLRVAEELKKCI